METEHGSIWIVLPAVGLPLGSNSHMIHGTPGLDPLRFTLCEVRQHEPSNLMCMESSFANHDWQPLEIGRLSHPEIGMAFLLAENFIFGHAQRMLELAAEAGAPAVSFHTYWVMGGDMPEEE